MNVNADPNHRMGSFISGLSQPTPCAIHRGEKTIGPGNADVQFIFEMKKQIDALSALIESVFEPMELIF